MLSFTWRDLRHSGRSLWVFAACLLLGVALVAAGGGLFRQVSGVLLDDARTLFGGDLEVQAREPLGEAELAWMRARGEVSLLVELRTMMSTASGRSLLVELQSFDDRYPLYGEVTLRPAAALREALARQGGEWGVALDPAIARRLGVGPGDLVRLGAITARVRALIARQPDRSLRADWRGPPVLLAAEALSATGLAGPGSRLAYRYRVRTAEPPQAWRSRLANAFPEAPWEIRTFAERSERVAEVLGQIASGLLLIGFSALFVGGLGVYNSVQAHLQTKLATMATLRALGLRQARLLAVYAGQVLMLAGAASAAGALLGGALALAGAGIAAERLPVAASLGALAGPLALAWLFGMLTALGFALPAIGRALSVAPAALFRGIDAAATRTPRAYWWGAATCGALIAVLLVASVPDPRFGLAFVAAVVLLLALLELLVRLLRSVAPRLAEHPRLARHFALRLALANLYRPGSPLRATLLSLGSALTLLVACALVVAALLDAVNETIPQHAPGLVFYDVPSVQLQEFRARVAAFPGVQQLEMAPFVLGRLQAVNGERLQESADASRVLEARDEHKLSYRGNDFDHLAVTRGAWWPQDHRGPPLVAMEDREADQLGLQIGDRLRFFIQGETVEAELAGIYAQRRFQSRFWFEAIFSDGVLDPYVTRYVGTADVGPVAAAALQDSLAAVAPGVVTVATHRILAEARGLLARAAAGLAVLAAVSLAASLLVLASIVASSRARQVYYASLLNTLGARIGVIRRSLQLEYVLLGTLTSVFAVVFGGAIAAALLEYRIKLEGEQAWGLAIALAVGASAATLGIGAAYLLRRLRASPAILLRSLG